jgi:hypothetical protein
MKVGGTGRTTAKATDADDDILTDHNLEDEREPEKPFQVLQTSY